MARKKKPKIQVRRIWGPLNPATRVIPDKAKRIPRKWKHKRRAADDGF